MHLYDPQAADPNLFSDRTVAVLGYGNQGHAHALNLRDSGVCVVIGQRPAGRGYDRAVQEGFDPMTVPHAVERADLVILTLPDESAADVFDREIAPVMRAGGALGFVHGFNIRYGYIKPPDGVDCIMVAPKGPGTLLRSLYVDGRGLPALVAVERDATGRALATALAWAGGIGAARAAMVGTTFAAETEADLFGEQVVLCGGVTALMQAAFDTLVDAGYDAELAYLECVHELKQVVDLVYERGLQGMWERISNTAEFGGRTRGARIITDAARQSMRRILDDVRSGAFAREWITEARNGAPALTRDRSHDAARPIERAGQSVRRLMPWLPGMNVAEPNGTAAGCQGMRRGD
ncbi:MAG: ketol-acid reductoisomerase [Phycisphaerales bacterium]|nr:ketol-acid reductoisomerase [Phycisphaerales bacterium]